MPIQKVKPRGNINKMKTIRISSEQHEELTKIAVREGLKLGKPVPVSKVLQAIIKGHVATKGIKPFIDHDES